MPYQEIAAALRISVTAAKVKVHRARLIDDWPERMVVFSIAAVLWVIFWRVSRRARVSGL